MPCVFGCYSSGSLKVASFGGLRLLENSFWSSIMVSIGSWSVDELSRAALNMWACGILNPFRINLLLRVSSVKTCLFGL